MFSDSFRKVRSILPILTFLLIALIGCSGGGQNPVQPGIQVPDNNGQSADTDTARDNRYLWGLSQFVCNIEEGTIEVSPLRVPEGHLNVIGFLETPYAQLLTIASEPIFDTDNDTVNVDVAIQHPFPGLNEFSGFDVRCILISHGTVTGYSDPDLHIPGEKCFRLRNADGYTRWWNPTEFKFDGYQDGKLGSPHTFFHFNATLNGYKMFANGLGADTPVTDLNLDDRGVFGAGQKLVRHFDIKYHVYGLDNALLIFNYAIDASYEFPDITLNDPDEYDVPGDFPLEANSTEPWHIEISEVENSLYYNYGFGGGSITYEVEVFDWQETASIGNVWCEMPGLIPYTEGTLIEDKITSAVFRIEVQDCTPEVNGPVKVLFVAESIDGEGYQGILPDTILAAYNMHETIVSDDVPNFPPVAVAQLVGSIDTIFIGQTLSFDASESFDIDGELSIYQWDFDGDGNFDEPGDDDYTGDSKNPTHAFDVLGEIHVDLLVIDAEDAFDTLDEKIVITVENWPGNNPPVAYAEPTSSTNIFITQWVGFDASASYDPDAGNWISSYEWDFDGDDNFDEPVDDAYSGSPVFPMHQFNEPGIFQVKLRVRDNLGAPDIIDEAITVSVNAFSAELLPDPYATRVKLLGPSPDQGGRPPDLSVLEKGGIVYTYLIHQDASGDSDAVHVYYDNYSISDFKYYIGPPQNPLLDWDDINRFCINGAGTVLTMLSANPDSYGEGQEPMYMYWNLFNGYNGYLQGSLLLSVPQRIGIDLSDGLRPDWLGGNSMYVVQLYDKSGLAPNPDPNPGNFIAARFGGNFEGAGFSIDAVSVPNMLGVGPGKIDDEDPLIMRLAVDDTIFGQLDHMRFYILDSAGEVEIVNVRAQADPYNLVGTITEFTGTPVDIECLNASEEFSVTFNWVAVLQDVEDGFIVQLMQFDEDTGDTVPVATSDPIPGKPLSIDVDDANFKIHVLAEYGGDIEATRFDYVP